MTRVSFKNKLFIGFGFLFFMIILLWSIGGFFIYNLSSRSAAMLHENYQTVESTKFLIQSLVEIKNQQIRYFFAEDDFFSDSIYQKNTEIFEKHLHAVRNNITERGEELIIEQLETNYENYLSTFRNLKENNIKNSTRFFEELIIEYSATISNIVNLWDANMNAISYKNKLLKSTAHRAFLFISIIGMICFLISAWFFFIYPKTIARPLNELVRGITEIAHRNYSQRLDFHSRDELGEVAMAFNTMAARLDEYEHSNLSELLFEKKRIDTIINNMKDAIIGLNDKNEIIFSNTNACEILQINESVLVGKTASLIAMQNPVFQNIMKDILVNPEQDFKDFKPLRISVNDKIRYFSREILDVKIVKTGETKSTRVGIVIVLKNITRFLEQDEAKTNFMATISHELKTPISSLRLNLKLLDDSRIGGLNSEQKQIVHALKTETSKMLTITSELLDLAQLETGNIQLNLHEVYTARLFEYVKDISDTQAKSKNIRINFNPGHNLPPVLADSEKTTWILLNLINNAIQYSPEKSEIQIGAFVSNDEVIYTVQDFGIGIEKKYLNQIFEKFFRVPGTDEKGTGLGLAISKELIIKQKGKIWAESIPGEGSTFFFSLPVYHVETKS